MEVSESQGTSNQTSKWPKKISIFSLTLNYKPKCLCMFLPFSPFLCLMCYTLVALCNIVLIGGYVDYLEPEPYPKSVHIGGSSYSGSGGTAYDSIYCSSDSVEDVIDYFDQYMKIEKKTAHKSGTVWKGERNGLIPIMELTSSGRIGGGIDVLIYSVKDYQLNYAMPLDYKELDCSEAQTIYVIWHSVTNP